jgi:hypothetical protein
LRREERITALFFLLVFLLYISDVVSRIKMLKTEKTRERRKKRNESNEKNGSGRRAVSQMEIKIKTRGAASDPVWCRECELDKTEEKEDIERLDECLCMHVQHHPPSCLFFLMW